MRPQTDFRPAAYVVIALGATLAFAAAVVPFYDAGYRLDLPVLFAGLAPYLVYGALTAYVRDRRLLVAGLLLLALDLALKFSERFLRDDGYTGLTFVVPLVAAGALALALALAARGHDKEPPRPVPPPESEPD